MASILSGKLRLKSQMVDLASLIRNVTITFRETAEAQNIQLVETLSDEVPSTMFADGDRLKQVVANLLENSINDRFTQAEVPSRHTPGGVGLGLAIAHHIVELHHGTINVASEGEGRGATFVVRLPLTDATKLSSNVHPQNP